MIGHSPVKRYRFAWVSYSGIQPVQVVQAINLSIGLVGCLGEFAQATLGELCGKGSDYAS